VFFVEVYFSFFGFLWFEKSVCIVKQV